MTPIYFKQDDEIIPMVERPYDAEDVLQELLADYPALLAGDADEDGDTRWLLVKRELGVAESESAGDRWSIDHLFLDADGVPTIVEVKRSTDTRIRREVVGQMLDYAANAAVTWSVDSIKASFEAECQRREEEPEQLVAELIDGDSVEAFWQQVATNLRAGRLRLVFVADRIPRELRRIVEFLNGQMNQSEVLALEVRQYVERGGERVTLVPALVGRTEAASSAKSSGTTRPRWTEAEFRRYFDEHLEEPIAGRLLRLYDDLKGAGARLTLGTGAVPSATLRLSPGSPTPVSIGFYPEGIGINFDFVRAERGDEGCLRLFELLAQCRAAVPYLEGVVEDDFRRRPTLPFGEILADDDSLEQFRAALVEASLPANQPHRLGT